MTNSNQQRRTDQRDMGKNANPNSNLSGRPTHSSGLDVSIECSRNFRQSIKKVGSSARNVGLLAALVVSLGTGFALGVFSSKSIASMAAPTEHKGLKLESLGEISEESLKMQIGLTGHKMQLRAIGIMPGGQIAKHSHAKRPGIVKVVSGSWIEGRADGEREYSGTDNKGILEDSGTVHWFWNRSDKLATALVCDIVPNK